MKKFQMIKKLKSVAKGIAALGLVTCLTGLPAMASSHSEAPLTSMDRYADGTDIYAFRSTEAGRSGFVTLIANFIPFQDPSGGPQFFRFDDSVLYTINVDNTGDGLPEVSYEFRFATQIRRGTTVLGMSTLNQNGTISSVNDPDYNMPQFYSVTLVRSTGGNVTSRTVLGNNVPLPPSNIGPKVTPNYEANLGLPSVHTFNTAGSKFFAGQRDEGFFIDVGGIFDFVGLRSARTDNGGIDSLAGFNVNTIAVEVPITALTRTGAMPTNSAANDAVIGVWATASRQATRVLGPGTQTNSGNFVQVSRLGNPLVNEVVIPLNLKDAFNAIRPHDDPGVGAPLVNALTDPELAFVLQHEGVIQHRPPAGRQDIVAIYATGIPLNTPGAPAGFTTFLSDGNPHEMLRLNVAILPATTGMGGTFSPLGLLGGDVAGFPNGRRVTDDIVDISLRVVAGGTPFTPSTNIAPNNILGDGVSQNENGFLDRFPYLNTPNQGNQPRFSNDTPPSPTCFNTNFTGPKCTPLIANP